VFGRHAGNVAFLPNLPSHSPVHLDNEVCHVRLRSDTHNVGPLALNVNGCFA
jgi:hypothetical protein